MAPLKNKNSGQKKVKAAEEKTSAGSSAKKASIGGNQARKTAGKKTTASAKKASTKEEEEAETDVKVVSVKIPIEEVAGADTEKAATSGQAVVEQTEDSPVTTRDLVDKLVLCWPSALASQHLARARGLDLFIEQKLRSAAAMSKVTVLLLSSVI